MNAQDRAAADAADAAGAADSAGLVATGLTVEGPAGTIVQPLDLAVPPGRMLAIIGESGSGKTMTARALTGLLPRGTRAAGEASVGGAVDGGLRPFGGAADAASAADAAGTAGTTDVERWALGSESDADWARVRGRLAVLLLQDPFTSLSPVIRCGAQIAATIRARVRNGGGSAARGEGPLGRAALAAEVERRLAEVRLPAEIARRYPSELSGGQRQRVAIAAALAAEPRLLIADEPTTALDASTQGEVLDLLRELQRAHRMSLILISHDLGVVAGRADEVIVMRGGEVVERGEASRVLAEPQHPYTRALLEANPTIAEATGGEAARGEAARGETAEAGTAGVGVADDPDAIDGAEPVAPPMLEARGISKSFGRVQALRDASVDVRAGEIVAVVGESGSGKSTFARCIAGLEIPDAGTVRLGGRELPRGRRGRTPARCRSSSRIRTRR
ncbi:ATP-binding cassette domain-containing protein [Leucobacter soli]|uniref:ATP-binding cassette domain-containing protein n=1 Tax=Leucobacter soli TaxID=2812850 RepID=UPI00360855D5